MNRCSSPGSIAVGGIKSISMWNLHHHHYYYYCKSGLGCCCTRGKESEVCLRRWTIFLVYLEKWAHGFSSFLLHRSRQTRTSEDSSCYDQSLWTLLGLSPLSWCGSLWSPGCLLTDHRVEVCSVCAVLSQITCEAGNCYWCSRLLTNVAATVICALIFFQSPFAL